MWKLIRSTLNRTKEMIYRNVCAFLQLFLFLFICRHILGYDTRDRAEKRVPMHGTVDKVYSFVNVSEA